MTKIFFVCTFLIALTLAQNPGPLKVEEHPQLPTQKCTVAGGCVQQTTSVVIDSNWRWFHTKEGYTNCFDGNYNPTYCQNSTACIDNCVVEGVTLQDYNTTYGVTTNGNALTLSYVTGTTIGSRMYLMQDNENYQMFNLRNKEFTFDIDASQLPCGLNGALYFSEMEQDGGKRFPSNKAGAKYGVGYCDAQCPHDIKFIEGEVNLDASYGACCAEMDIWEANSKSTVYTPHPCNKNGLYKCQGDDCGDGDKRYSGTCDKDGCDFNSYRQGDKEFYGPGKKVDTNKKFTVVTQFITSNSTDAGDLVEIRRYYVQDGKLISNSVSSASGIPNVNAINSGYCDAQKIAFNNTNHFKTQGGLSAMGNSLNKGMVLVMSVWDDFSANMLWLDSKFPPTALDSQAGAYRGNCPTSSGDPNALRQSNGSAKVTFSNIKWGELGSTFTAPVLPTSTNIVPNTLNPSVSSSIAVPKSTSSSIARNLLLVVVGAILLFV